MSYTIQELRDKLAAQKALYQASLERAELAQDKIRKTLDTVDAEFVHKLKRSNGIDLEILTTMDLERMKHDQEYREDVSTKLDLGINQLREFVERSLNV